MTGSRHPLGWVAPEPVVASSGMAPVATVPEVPAPEPEMVNVTQLPRWVQDYIGELEERAFRLEQELAALKARFAP